MDETPFTVEELKQSGIEERLGDTIEEILGTPSANQRHYSITGEMTVLLRQRGPYRLFFKKHAPQYDRPISHVDDRSPTTIEQRTLRAMHLREYNFLNEIGNNINRTLVPTVLGKLTNPEKGIFVLFTECLDGLPAKEKYLRLWQGEYQEKDQKRKEKNQKARLDLLQTDFRRIAKFVGNCHAKKHNLSESITEWLEEGDGKLQEGRLSRLENYILRAVDYQVKQGNPSLTEEFNRQTVKHQLWNENGIDVEGSLKRILSLKDDSIIYERRLQHGDCRPDHNFSGVFCDLEDFGYYPHYHDVVTYTSDETTALPVSKLPGFLAYYLLYEKAYSSKSSSIALHDLEELDTTQSEKLESLVTEKIGQRKFADFVVGYFAGAIEEDIIINGVRKKYLPERLQAMVGEYLNPEDLQSSRVNHIISLYAFITSVEAGPLFQYCSQSEGVAEYFYQLGTLLNEIGIIATKEDPSRRIPRLDYLRKLSAGSQFALFFGSGSNPALPSRERKSA